MREFDPMAVVYFVVTLIPAIVLHELAHGIVADRMGDTTPRLMGRLTLNPVKHADPFGSLILPGLLLLPRLFGQQVLVFGYAKPMPINTLNLRNPDRQMVLIALAGPLTNLLLGAAGALVLRFVGFGNDALTEFLFIWVSLNILLAVFNVMPIPPLDGSKVLALFLPPRAREVYRSWEPYGALFMLVIFFIFPGPVFGIVLAVRDGLLRLILV
jgi:Zn-dependent protease